MNSSIIKLTLREIKGSLGRYIAIFAIIALGAGLFMGLRMSKPDFIETYERYAGEYNFYDYRLVSTLGLTQKDLDAVRKLDFVVNAEGVVSSDFLFNTESADNLIMVAQTIPEKINLIKLQAGRMPEKGSECLADPEIYSEADIGTTIKLSKDNSEQTFDTFAYDEYTIVGLADSVLYINYERGTSTLGNGSVEGYIYLLPKGFSTDYFTDIYLDLDADGGVYSDEYKEQTEQHEAALKTFMKERAVLRRDDIIDDAMAELDDAKAQYEDGLSQYEPKRAEYESGAAQLKDEKTKAMAQLEDAKRQLEEAESMMKDPSILDEKQAEIDAARAQLDAGYAEYQSGVVQFEARKALAYATVNANIEIDEISIRNNQNSIANYTADLERLNAELAAAEAEGASSIRISMLRTEIRYAQARLDDSIDDLARAQGKLEKRLAEKAEIDAELAPYQKQLDDAKAEIDAGYAQLNAGQAELDNARAMIINGKAEIEAGWAQYNAGKAEADKKFAEAEAELNAGKAQLDAAKAELDDAKKQLDDAEKQIKNIEHADTYVLGRDTNVGYVCFDSDTQVVASIAGVFPVFFFLVAALVCLTTMTRMVDDQRTQVGIMKALGYDSGEIMAKYLFYSGSATFLGCIFGIGLGSVAFPALIWFGYSLMYNIAGLSFTMNWLAAVLVLLSNMLLMLGVTWYCCRRELKSAPAELIRPKAPEAGKRIFLEKLPKIWNKLNFMHKVSARNIFRYKKRLFMIVLGVGGCTALVLTALGLNDTIREIVSRQYDDVSHYDYELTLAYDMTKEEQRILIEECDGNLDNIMFMYEATVEVQTENGVKNASLIAADENEIRDFYSLRSGRAEVAYPGLDEAIIDKNLERMLDVHIGDSIEITTADMDKMTVTVSGIFDNYVSHSIYVSMDTITKQWGYTPEVKSALACALKNTDVYKTGEKIAEADGVRGISLCADTKARIENMLEGLNYIVAAIIFCAGLLAFIVLYNLTNINISERIREIATIKVLGFYPKESALYVFRENMVLTGMGAVFGLLLGILFHAFVMNRIKVDMLYFEPYIKPLSFLIAIAITFVFSVIVNSIMRRRIDNIDMAGALKSIE